jgi:hypothetical protein
MSWFLSRLNRERRRFALVALLTFLGGWLAFRGSPEALYGVRLEIVAAFAFMFGLTAALAAVVLIFPQMRSHAETIALSIPCLSLAGAFDPQLDGWASFLILVFGLLIIYPAGMIYGGSTLDSFVPRRNRSYRSTSTSTLTPEELWPYFCVTPDSPPEFRMENTISLEWLEPGRRFREVAHAGEGKTIEEVQTILMQEPHSLYQFHFQSVHAPDAPGHRGVYTHRLTRTDHGTAVETLRQYDTDSWRTALFIWVDDAFSRSDDAKLKAIEAKERARQS